MIEVMTPWVSVTGATIVGSERTSVAVGKSAGRIWPSSRSHRRDHSLNQPSSVDFERHTPYAASASGLGRVSVEGEVSQRKRAAAGHVYFETAAVIIALLSWRREVESPLLPAERLLGAVRDGWRYTRASAALQAVLVRVLCFFLGASAGMSLLPLIVRNELKGSAMDFGILLGCVGAGAIENIENMKLTVAADGDDARAFGLSHQSHELCL